MSTDKITDNNSDAAVADAIKRQERARDPRNWYSGRYREEEDKPQTTQDAAPSDTPTAQEPGPDANLSPKEKTYEKRYGDLRRDYQKTTEKLNKQIDELKEKLDNAVNKPGNLPISEKEIAEWVAEYPQLASIVTRLAETASNDRMEIIAKRLEEIEEQSSEVARERAYLELKKLHPDIDDIRESEDFHSWASEQPDEIQAWFYEPENETKPWLAARGIDMYKVEVLSKKQKQKKKDPAKDNSRVVSPSGDSVDLNTTGGKKIWKESEIKRMKPREFEQHEAEIDQALIEGRVEFDLQKPRNAA